MEKLDFSAPQRSEQEERAYKYLLERSALSLKEMADSIEKIQNDALAHNLSILFKANQTAAQLNGQINSLNLELASARSTNDELVLKNSSLTADLTAVSDELKNVSSLLNTTTQTLELTKQELNNTYNNLAATEQKLAITSNRLQQAENELHYLRTRHPGIKESISNFFYAIKARLRRTFGKSDGM